MYSVLAIIFLCNDFSRRLVLQRKMSVSANGIEYSHVIPKDKYNDIIILLRNNFFADEPLNQSLQLCKPGDPHKYLEEHCYKTLKDNYSIIAHDKNTGEVSEQNYSHFINII